MGFDEQRAEFVPSCGSVERLSKIRVGTEMTKKRTL